MKTMEIRNKIKASRKKHWQLAADIGISEATLVRWLREEEMPTEHQQIILVALERTGVKSHDNQ